MLYHLDEKLFFLIKFWKDFSEYTLTENDKQFLREGSNFDIAPRTILNEEIIANVGVAINDKQQ